MSTPATHQPLHDLDEWDDFLAGRYKEGKSAEEFRVYDSTATPGVAEFYRLNHENMTVEYVLGKEKEYFSLNKGQRASGRQQNSQYADRRQRPGHRSNPDRASAADL